MLSGRVDARPLKRLRLCGMTYGARDFREREPLTDVGVGMQA